VSLSGQLQEFKTHYFFQAATIPTASETSAFNRKTLLRHILGKDEVQALLLRVFRPHYWELVQMNFYTHALKQTVGSQLRVFFVHVQRPVHMNMLKTREFGEVRPRSRTRYRTRTTTPGVPQCDAPIIQLD
jgi:hypothetical protein